MYVFYTCICTYFNMYIIIHLGIFNMYICTYFNAHIIIYILYIPRHSHFKWADNIWYHKNTQNRSHCTLQFETNTGNQLHSFKSIRQVQPPGLLTFKLLLSSLLSRYLDLHIFVQWYKYAQIYSYEKPLLIYIHICAYVYTYTYIYMYINMYVWMHMYAYLIFMITLKINVQIKFPELWSKTNSFIV